MQIKTINAVISKKFEEWVGTITDQGVVRLVRENTILTGGAICSMLKSELVNDFDFYFKNKETAIAVARYYVGLFQAEAREKGGTQRCVDVVVDNDRVSIKVTSAGVASNACEGQADLSGNDTGEEPVHAVEEDKDKPKYRPVFLSSNAITLSHGVQLVIRFYGSPSEIHENYDYVHCTNYWTSWENKVVTNKEALESILTMQLVYVGSKYPLASLIRMRKFIGRGWKINAGQVLKMAFQVSQLNLSDIPTLEDQLTGVDTTYFKVLIDALREVQEKDPTRINSSYIGEIINRMF